MRKYRYPTSILWSHPDGFRHLEAEDAEDAMSNIPAGIGITLQNLQVWTGSRWEWVTEAKRTFGGIKPNLP